MLHRACCDAVECLLAAFKGSGRELALLRIRSRHSSVHGGTKIHGSATVVQAATLSTTGAAKMVVDLRSGETFVEHRPQELSDLYKLAEPDQRKRVTGFALAHIHGIA